MPAAELAFFPFLGWRTGNFLANPSAKHRGWARGASILPVVLVQAMLWDDVPIAGTCGSRDIAFTLLWCGLFYQARRMRLPGEDLIFAALTAPPPQPAACWSRSAGSAWWRSRSSGRSPSWAGTSGSTPRDDGLPAPPGGARHRHLHRAHLHALTAAPATGEQRKQLPPAVPAERRAIQLSRASNNSSTAIARALHLFIRGNRIQERASRPTCLDACCLNCRRPALLETLLRTLAPSRVVAVPATDQPCATLTTAPAVYPSTEQ